jgi:high-affinity nickel-transport protein
LKLEGKLWDAIGTLNDNFGTLGYVIIGVFAASWIVSMVLYRTRRFDELGTSR